MYLSGPADTVSGLGFSIPPWVTRIAGAVVSGRVVTVPTPVGSLTFDLSNPDSLAALAKMVSGARVTTTTPAGPTAPRPSFADSIPGGWPTIIGGSLLLFYFLRRR